MLTFKEFVDNQTFSNVDSFIDLFIMKLLLNFYYLGENIWFCNLEIGNLLDV